MQRLEDWPERLDAFVHDMKERPFAWGSNDCASFAAAWIERCTGARPAMPAWSNEFEAMRIIKGAGGLEAAVRAVLGEPLEYPGAAQRGDVALTRNGEREFVGVVLGAWVAGPGEEGILCLPRTDMLVAWRV